MVKISTKIDHNWKLFINSHHDDINWRFMKLNIVAAIVGVIIGCSFAVPMAGQTVSDIGEWPQFRGPRGDGHANAHDLPAQFDDQHNLTWKTSIPGRAWSSPVIVEDQIWLSTALETKSTGEELEKKMASARIGGMSAYSHVELQALCVDRETGKITQKVTLFEMADPPLIHSLNSFASPTPVTHGERVIFHFGTFGTACVDRASGKVSWRTQEYQLDHETGPGSSPIIWNDLLIFHCDGYDQQYVVALDATTGEQIWRTQRSGKLHEQGSYKKAFSTPIIIRRRGQDELVSAASNWIYGYDPASGDELWKVSYGQLGFSNVARPIADAQTIYVCSCFMQSKMLAIDVSGSEPPTDDDVKWSVRGQVPNMPSPILVDGLIYFVSDRGIVSCVDAESGDQKWRERLDGEFCASPLYADNKLYFGNRNGQLFVLVPDPDKLNLQETNQLDSAIMASPAAVGDSLYVRTRDSLYRFGQATSN